MGKRFQTHILHETWLSSCSAGKQKELSEPARDFLKIYIQYLVENEAPSSLAWSCSVDRYGKVS